jgi:hypothetical protein
VDNRLDLPDSRAADIHTPEQFQPTEWVKVDEQAGRLGSLPNV